MWRLRGRSRRWLLPLFLAWLAGVVLLFIWIQGNDGDKEGSAGKDLSELSAPTRKRIAKLSTGQKIDAVMVLGFEGRDASSPFLAELRRHQLGGVFVATENWTDQAQGAALIAALKKAARRGGPVPPAIVTSQQGGERQSFPDLPPATPEPEIGQQASGAAAESSARKTGKALREVGIDLNLFPDGDVATVDSPLAGRAFSDDPGLVAKLTAASVRGCAKARIACAPGYFPGLGAASQDTDDGPATIGSSAKMLAERDLPAFVAAIAARAPAIELSHAYYVAYDPVTPGSMTPAVVTGLLRGELGFKGVAITDDLGAGAITAQQDPAAAAPLALAAGADMVLIGTPGAGPKVRAAISKALAGGTLEMDRLSVAAGRVMNLKQRLGLVK
jgi:beta-N-acetylhexosaminidase